MYNRVDTIPFPTCSRKNNLLFRKSSVDINSLIIPLKSELNRLLWGVALIMAWFSRMKLIWKKMQLFRKGVVSITFLKFHAWNMGQNYGNDKLSKRPRCFVRLTPAICMTIRLHETLSTPCAPCATKGKLLWLRCMRLLFWLISPQYEILRNASPLHVSCPSRQHMQVRGSCQIWGWAMCITRKMHGFHHKRGHKLDQQMNACYCTTWAACSFLRQLEVADVEQCVSELYSLRDARAEVPQIRRN